MKPRRKTTPENLSRLATEQPNRASADLDLKSALEVARIINAEDAKVANAVQRALPQIARAIDLIANALRRGGRLIYVGAGTSGRIAALDAAELPPTFNADPETVQFVIAGGLTALAAAAEANEDSRELGEREIAKKKPNRNDVVVGIAASGRTPFTVAALSYAHKKGAKTIAITCNRNSPLQKAAHLAIVTEVGPEVISGSTRMKAGTSQKMVMNMLSSGAGGKHSAARCQSESGNRATGFEGRRKQRPRGAGYAASPSRPPGSRASTEIKQRTRAPGD